MAFVQSLRLLIVCSRKNCLLRRYSRNMDSKLLRPLSDNLTFIPFNSEGTIHSNSSIVVTSQEHRGLVLLFEYMNAKKKHVDKFVQFYNDRQFDVLAVSLKPWQLFWPVKGSQVVAKQVADFLLLNTHFTPIVYHGFSVGGYLWGEVLHIFLKDRKKYENVIGRLRGQILDSGVDVSEIPTAFPAAVFPDRPVLRNIMEKFIRYQMNILYYQSTKHYIASRAAISSGIVNVPTLLLYSKDSDPLSTPDINGRLDRDFQKKDIICYHKQFSGSKHVMHYQKFSKEYLNEVEAFLLKLNLNSHVTFHSKL